VAHSDDNVAALLRVVFGRAHLTHTITTTAYLFRLHASAPLVFTNLAFITQLDDLPHVGFPVFVALFPARCGRVLLRRLHVERTVGSVRSFRALTFRG
jgi:hypothetical protein